MNKDDIINYLIDKYGKDYVASVGNRNFYAGKSAIRDLGQVYNIPSADTQLATKEYNNELTVEENIVNSKTIKSYFESYPELKDKVDRLTGTVSALGVHAGGVVLSDATRGYSLREWCALQRPEEQKRIATLWTKKEVEQIGLIKYDILGLSSASQIHYAQKLAGLPVYKDHPEKKAVFQHIVLEGKHKNIFQFETHLGKKAFDDLMPMSIMEISNASGLIRMVGSESGRQIYETYKTNIEEIQRGEKDGWKERIRDQVYEDYNYDVSIKVMAESYGVLIYQEQLSYLVAGFSKGNKTFNDGNKVRKLLDKLGETGTISEKQGNKEALKKWHTTFMDIMNEYVLPFIGKDGWDCPDKTVTDFLNFNLDEQGVLPIPNFGIISWMIAASAYLFSKLHAVAYSTNTYNMMYLKYFHPLEFWTASLICEQSDIDKVKSYINAIETEEEGTLKILPPDINESDKEFKMIKGLDNEADRIRYGLGAILNLGKSADAIITERNKNGRYESIEDFCNRIPKKTVNKRVIENLMFVGAFDSFGNLQEVYDELMRLGKDFDEYDLTDKEFLLNKEMKLLGVNLKYKHPLLKTAHFYMPIDQMVDGDVAQVAVRVLKATKALTKKGKPYIMGRIQDINSGVTINLFDWNNGKNFEMKDNMITLLNIKKDGGWYHLVMERR